MMADRSTNKNIRNSVTSDDIISKKMKPNTERLDMVSTSTSESENQEHELIITTNYNIQHYNSNKYPCKILLTSCITNTKKQM